MLILYLTFVFSLNPFYVPELKHLTGNDAAVQEYVMKSPLAKKFVYLKSLLETAMPGYIHEGKSSLTIAIGCTGGATPFRYHRYGLFPSEGMD